MLPGIKSRARFKTAAIAPVVVVCLVLLISTSVFGQGFTRVSVPIPVEIEGQPIHCQLYLKLEMKSYNLPFDAFAAQSLDKAQTMFVTGVEAIRKQDTAKFASVWTSPDDMKSRGGVTVKMADESIANWIKLARSNFDFDHLTVVAEVLLGSESMFIFDSPARAGVQRYALYVGLDQKDQTRLSAVSSGTPLELMVLNSFIAARTAPDQFKLLTTLNLRYQYPIPLAGKSDTGAHPVFFEFDGTPIDFPLTNEKVKPSSPLLEFLRTATLAYVAGKYDVYASSFTPKSQEKVRQWLAAEKFRQEQLEQQQKLEQEKQKQQKPSVSAPAVPPAANAKGIEGPSVQTYVKFVLNADPLFIVFQTLGQGSGWIPANLSYSYILRQGSDYKITNFAFSNTLDDFLQNPTLFDKKILKPAPQKPGSPKTNVTPVATKPPAVKH